MTCFLYTGTPGSGKSLHMAKLLYWQIKMKRPCVANFDVNRDMFRDTSTFSYVPNNELTPEKLEQIAVEYFKDHEFKEGTLKLFIDEAQCIFSSRLWRETGRDAWIRFFTQHRKLGYDVYLVCQHHEMIDKQIRSLVEYEVSHRKVNNVGLFGKCVSFIFLGHPVVCAVTRWYGQKMRLGAEWLLGTRKYYRLYDTLKLFSA